MLLRLTSPNYCDASIFAGDICRFNFWREFGGPIAGADATGTGRTENGCAADAFPSATPTLEELVDSLSPADLQAFMTLLKANFTDPDAITDTELSRATVEGLLVRLPRGITFWQRKKAVPARPQARSTVK